MADIFLSYARPDLEPARMVAADLESEGFSVFFDQHIGVGENWDALIESEIEAAKSVVVLWSPTSRDREWVRNEARFGRQRGVLCPALISACVVPLEFNGMQTADLQQRAAGDRTHPEWRRLVSAISRFAGSPVEAARAKVAAATVEVGNQAYWKAFQPIAESHGRIRKSPREVKSENYNTPLDRVPGFEIYSSAYVTRSKSKRYGAYLWFWAAQPESSLKLMPLLQDLKGEVEKAMAEPILLEKMSKHGIWIHVSREGDPDDRAAWPKQHGWLAERMGKLATIYRDQIKVRMPEPAPVKDP